MSSPVSVVIVEESAADAELLVARLRAWGYVPEWARVDDAIGMRAALARRSWDVVISDWSSPRFNGPEAIALLREHDVDVPIIAVSSVADDAVAVDAIRRGANDYLSKDNLARLGGAVEREIVLRTQRAKRREEDRRFFDVTPELFCVVGFDGYFKRVNPAWHAALGWSTEELCSRPWMEFLHPDDRASALERQARMRAGERTPASESRYRHEDGTYRWLEWAATPVGDEQVVYTAARDVTERRKTEDALRASQARFARLAESGIVSIAIADLHGRYVEVNDAYALLLGYSRDELLSGQVSWVNQTPPEWRAADRVAVAQLGEIGVAAPFEKELFHKDGSRVPVLIGVAMLDASNCIAFVSDLTQLKQAEEAVRHGAAVGRHSQKMEALGTLAAGVAHEINTPAQYVTDNLTFLQRAIGGLLDALQPATLMLAQAKAGHVPMDTIARLEAALLEAEVEFLAEDVPRSLAQSLEGIRRVTSIVAAMKTFSHPSSAQKTLTNLRDMVDTTLSVTRNRWKYVADVKTELDPDLPLVPCLRDELAQVILNLVVNAADSVSERTHAGADGKGTITVTARRDGEWAELRVADTGAGIPERIRGRIFDPFFTTKTVGNGTGQGLAIAHAVIVDKHAGKISFETEEGKGTTFVVRIPMTARNGSGYSRADGDAIGAAKVRS